MQIPLDKGVRPGLRELALNTLDRAVKSFTRGRHVVDPLLTYAQRENVRPVPVCIIGVVFENISAAAA